MSRSDLEDFTNGQRLSPWELDCDCDGAGRVGPERLSKAETSRDNERLRSALRGSGVLDVRFKVKLTVMTQGESYGSDNRCNGS